MRQTPHPETISMETISMENVSMEARDARMTRIQQLEQQIIEYQDNYNQQLLGFQREYDTAIDNHRQIIQTLNAAITTLQNYTKIFHIIVVAAVIIGGLNIAYNFYQNNILTHITSKTFYFVMFFIGFLYRIISYIIIQLKNLIGD